MHSSISIYSSEILRVSERNPFAALQLKLPSVFVQTFTSFEPIKTCISLHVGKCLWVKTKLNYHHMGLYQPRILVYRRKWKFHHQNIQFYNCNHTGFRRFRNQFQRNQHFHHIQVLDKSPLGDIYDPTADNRFVTNFVINIKINGDNHGLYP